MKKFSMLATSALVIADATSAPLNLNFAAPFEAQVQEYFEGLGDFRGVTHVALSGQAVAAIVALPVLELVTGQIPQIALVPFGTSEVAGWLNGANFRHNLCREMRDATPVEALAGYTVIDGGGRGMTPAQLEELATLLGCTVGEIRVSSTNPGQVDIADLGGAAGVKIAEGICGAMKAAGFPVAETAATSRLLFLPAGAGIVGAVQALALHGFTGAWPRTIRLAGTPALGFKVAEVVDPQAMRQWASSLAKALDAAKPVAALSGTIPEAFRSALAALGAEHGVEIRG